MDETLAYIGLGSNLGDRAGYLLLAVRGLLDAGLQVARLSAIYATAPVDYEDQPEFLNQVATVRVGSFTPEQVLARLLRIEYALGRRRETEKGPRTIDLDLLLCGDAVRRTELLTLPHPRLHLRRFVLAPLAEIAPAARHPTLGLTASEMLANLTDTAAVRRWEVRSGE
jgi:2-amino-4-hydroxy-6-hydroxymethyldihydropteridine diphosphokinase